MTSIKNATLAFVAALVVFALEGGASAARKIDPAVLASIKRVGVVSVAGDTLVAQKLGITAFGNKRETFNVADWGLDEIWQAQLVDALVSKGGFEFVALTPADSGALLEFYEQEPGRKAADAAAAIVAANRLDALVIFAAASRSLYPTNQYLEKYGIFYDKTALKKTSVYYLIGRLYLVGADGKKIDTQYLEGEAHKGLGAFPHTPAPDELDEVWYTAYSPEQKEALRQSLVALPAALWAPAIDDLLETK